MKAKILLIALSALSLISCNKSPQREVWNTHSDHGFVWKEVNYGEEWNGIGIVGAEDESGNILLPCEYEEGSITLDSFKTFMQGNTKDYFWQWSALPVYGHEEHVIRTWQLDTFKFSLIVDVMNDVEYHDDYYRVKKDYYSKIVDKDFRTIYEGYIDTSNFSCSYKSSDKYWQHAGNITNEIMYYTQQKGYSVIINSNGQTIIPSD